MDSNAMKSSNPHSGIYEAETSRTLDQNGGNPNCNQGGHCVVKRTMTSGKEIAQTLFAGMTHGCHGWQECHTGDWFVNDAEWVIRKLTPTECARLQGFPDWWCDNLASEPTDEEVDEWMEIFNTHSLVVNGKPSSKSRNQVIKWLRDPHSDSAEYKMWGNGVALPCVDYIMAGIAYWSQQEIEEKQDVRQMTIEEWLKEENQ